MHDPAIKRTLHRTAVVAIVAVAAACADDSSPLNVAPSTPSATQVVGDSVYTATVATTLPDPVGVTVTDQYGNPVADVDVGFAVTAGGGSVGATSVATDSSGTARTQWTLGTQAGTNTLEVTADAGDVGPLTLRAEGTPGPPATVAKIAGDQQTDTVARQLADAIVVQIQDEYGNAIEGETVEWTLADTSAALAAATSTTDTAGQATNTWTLGTAAGQQTLVAGVGNIQPATFTATAEPDAPSQMSLAGGDGQAGAAGSELPEALTVRVADQYDNGVPDVAVDWVVLEGGGSVDTTPSLTDADGIASVRYTLGSSPGDERVAARLGSTSEVIFELQAGDPNNLYIDGLHITQATQTYAGGVPLVADRDGVLRVFVLADSANGYTPDVEVLFYDNGSLVRADTLAAPEDSVRTSPVIGELGSTWNLDLPASLIQPGLEIRVEVDPANNVLESDEDDNTYPADGSPGALDVRSLSDFMVRLVPIHIPNEGTTGDVNEDNKDDYLAAAQAMMPLPGYDADVRSTYTTSAASDSSGDDWVTIIQEVEALRADEGTSRYYYGVIGYTGDAAYCGLGYRPGKTAIGLDQCGGGTAAHEWGHNWDRLHAPCGNPGNPDENYPYEGGSIGVVGMDVAAGQLKSPSNHYDLMSYCSPEWISDYTYEGVLSYREAEGDAAAAPFAVSPEPSLIVWGRISPDGVVLEPAFESTTQPKLPQADGPYRVEGLADDGSTLFSLSFAGTPVDHMEGHRHFAFAVPAHIAGTDRLDRIRLTAPGRSPAEVRRPDPAADLRPDLRAASTGPDRVRLDWNGAAFPMAVVRDAATGDIVSFARGGSAVVVTGAGELDLTLSSGVGEVRQRVRVR